LTFSFYDLIAQDSVIQLVDGTKLEGTIRKTTADSLFLKLKGSSDVLSIPQNSIVSKNDSKTIAKFETKPAGAMIWHPQMGGGFSNYDGGALRIHFQAKLIAGIKLSHRSSIGLGVAYEEQPTISTIPLTLEYMQSFGTGALQPFLQLGAGIAYGTERQAGSEVDLQTDPSFHYNPQIGVRFARLAIPLSLAVGYSQSQESYEYVLWDTSYQESRVFKRIAVRLGFLF
jgi:hypothetical protein